MNKIKDPEVVLVEPEHREAAGEGIQPGGTISPKKLQKSSTSKDGEEKCEGEGGPSSPSKSPNQPDDDTDVGWQTADDQSDDEVPPQMLNEIIEVIEKLQVQLQEKPDKEVRIHGPPGLQVSLYDHQEYALAWMLWRESCSPAGGILADDMGLGKTVTTIALIIKSLENEYLQKTEDSRENPGGTLIVCPANLTYQWKNEILTKGNIEKVIVHLGNNETSLSMLTESQIVITSYEGLSQNYESNDKIFFKINWKRVVLDEASVRSKSVGELLADKRWALTGTPIHKGIKDIFPILRFLKLKPFDDFSVFNKWITTDDAAGKLQCLLDCVMLKRTRADLVNFPSLPELPPKTGCLIDVTLKSEENRINNKLMISSKTLIMKFNDQMKEEKRQMGFGDSIQLTSDQKEFLGRRDTFVFRHFVALITRLRQICCHPALMKESLEIEDFEGTGVDTSDADVLMKIDREILEGLTELGECIEDEGEGKTVDYQSSKIIAILKLVQEIMEKGEKVVIFSDWVNYLNLIGQHLGHISGVNYGFYTGKMSQDERNYVVDQFNGSEEMKILLVSLRAGVQRLDLKAANHVIFADLHWNPEKEAQAVNTVYRVGQTKEVFIHKFVCQSTIEANIVALQEKKKGIVEVGLADGSEHDLGKLSTADISSLIKM